MSSILTSLHGRKVGLDKNGDLISGRTFRAGYNGKQRTFGSPATIEFWDDFTGDVILDQWSAVEGTDSATSDFAILAGGIGGVGRLTTGDAGTGIAADMEQITQALQWQASNGGLTIEARLKLSAITTCYAFIGFTDLVTFEAPIIGATGTTITTNASDAVGFMFDTTITTADWNLVGVAANTDATRQATGYAPVADKYATFRIELGTDGGAVFFYNGVQVGTRMAGAVTAATDLTPTICVSKLSVAASMTLDLDYVHVSQNRGLDGASV